MMSCMCTEIMKNEELHHDDDQLDQLFEDLEMDEPDLDVSNTASEPHVLLFSPVRSSTLEPLGEWVRLALAMNGINKEMLAERDCPCCCTHTHVC